MVPRKHAAKPDGAPDEDSTRLAILLEDYSNCRDDDRNWWMVVATLVAVAITLVGLLFAAVTQTCRFNTSASCTRVPDYVVAGAPLLPIAIVAFMQMIGTLSTVRSFYLRAIEQEIRGYAGGPLKALPMLEPASYIDLTMEITSMRRGRLAYRLLAVALIIATLMVFGGLATYIAIHLSGMVQALMALVYGPLVGFLAYESYASGPGGRSVFSGVIKAYLAHRNVPRYMVSRLGDDRPPRDGERPLVSYLLFPRPADWVKLLIAPGAFLVACWAIGSFENWRRFILIWIILEYLIYAARYQWNDVRGVHEDPDHPGKVKRMRLPGGEHAKRNIVISILVALLRIALALSIAAAAHVFTLTVLLIILVFGVAVIYEAFRAESARWAVQGWAQARIAGIWITVGLGYAIRSGIGIRLAGYALSSFQEIVTVIFFAAYGVMFVLLAWVLEAASYCQSDGASILSPQPALSAKPHISILLNWCGWTLEGGANSVRGDGLPILKDKRGSIYAPWNISLLLGAVVGAAAGFGFLGLQLRLGELLIVATVSGAGAFALTLVVNFRMRVGVTILVSAVLIGTALWADHRVAAIIAGLPWIAAAGLYSFFRESSYRDMMDFGPNFIMALKAAAHRIPLGLLWVVVGRQTWRYVGFGPQVKQKRP